MQSHILLEWYPELFHCSLVLLLLTVLQRQGEFRDGVNPDQCPICKEELGRNVSASARDEVMTNREE